MFTLNITTDNAAFHEDDREDDEDTITGATRSEVARILRDAAKHIEAGSDSRNLQDSNGNRVGSFSF